MATPSARDVAAELRARLPGLTGLKLHKLLYYCQGHHLATFGEALFSDRVSAWDMGPVVGSLWHEEKNGPPAPGFDSELGESALNTVGYVLSRYGSLSGRDLINLTHNELPWRRADSSRRPGESTLITPEWMQEYFGNEPPDDGEIVLDPAEVGAWLSSAGSRLDEPSRPDDPDEILARIATLRSETGTRDAR